MMKTGPDHGWCETIEAHAGLITDLLNCAIYEIDFQEIAEHGGRINGKPNIE